MHRRHAASAGASRAFRAVTDAAGNATGRVLWTGAPDPAGFGIDRRRWALALLLAVGGAVYLAWWFRDLLRAPAWWQLAPFVLLAFLPVIGLLLFRPSRRLVPSSYTITDRQVIVERRSGRRHARSLTSLGALTLSLESGDLGTIRFAGPPRARVAEMHEVIGRVLGQQPPDQGQPLLEHIAHAQSVFAILRAAQGAELAASGHHAPAEELPPIRPPSELIIAVRSPVTVFGVISLLGIYAFWMLPQGIATPWGHVGPLTLVFVGLFLGMVAFAVLTIHRRSGARRLREQGIVTRGTVAELVEFSSRMHEDTQWLVAYRYRDVAGRPYVGYGSPMPSEETQLWPVGATVQVRYDPARPEQSIALRSPSDAPPRWPTWPATTTPGSREDEMAGKSF